ncbi:hypothetical protein CLOBOL_06439 [Enterocloster bolteae ATCC BAA-613]|uniref:Uncharacterized protein n=1 Tax=Enterocloster bolteae (strain ATCC BAA-613 / DSM 15670 / CCUG 46953 / JCM 12243 / WAL 16351) TaxID=411902 RepID=A8S2Y4_ENTBW|nr:hypothetical protein CLOBOL_06439 [Enterocloster bolteae ATCC BAA-613]
MYHINSIKSIIITIIIKILFSDGFLFGAILIQSLWKSL